MKSQLYIFVFSRDDNVVTRAIELNEQLERILQRHDALISRRTTLISTHIDHEQAGEEEEAEQLLRRLIYCNTIKGGFEVITWGKYFSEPKCKASQFSLKSLQMASASYLVIINIIRI